MTGAAPNAPAAPQMSVIVPHLNQPEHLERCLTSLSAQTGATVPFEIIVVDNGSEALPTALCERFGARLEQESAPGPGPARNHGIARAQTDLLAFIDADCVADPGWIAAIAERLKDPKAGFALGGDVRINRANEETTTLLEAYEGVFAYRQKEYIERKGFSGTGNLAMRRHVHERVGPFAGIGIAEDADWGQRATALGVRIVYVPEMIVFHPARTTFAELKKKWDRHVGHDFERFARPAWRRALWLGRACAVAASGVIDLRHILASDRISGWRERALAFAGLLRIRLYRFRIMLGLLFARDGSGLSGAWNRK